MILFRHSLIISKLHRSLAVEQSSSGPVGFLIVTELKQLYAKILLYRHFICFALFGRDKYH